MTESGTLARVLFDEAHSEAWTIRPELARQMQPAHPGDSSYARAAPRWPTATSWSRSNAGGSLSARRSADATCS